MADTLHPLADYADITSDLADLGPEDTVFRSPSGRTIKVKAIRQTDSVPFSMLVLKLTGSDCDEAGKAIADGAAYRVGPVHPFTAQAFNPATVADDLDLARRLVADEIERIATVAEMELPGVG